MAKHRKDANFGIIFELKEDDPVSVANLMSAAEKEFPGIPLEELEVRRGDNFLLLGKVAPQNPHGIGKVEELEGRRNLDLDWDRLYTLDRISKAYPLLNTDPSQVFVCIPEWVGTPVIQPLSLQTKT